MWMARGCQGHGCQRCKSPWTQKSSGYTYSGQGHQDCYRHLRSCQRLIMQTLSTASAAVTAMQQGSTQVHKQQEKHREDGKSAKGRDKDDTSKGKEQDGMKRQNCYCCGATPAHPKCPAKDVVCQNCGNKGHYQKCCKSKRANSGKHSKFKQTQIRGLQTQPVANDILASLQSTHIQATTRH